MWPFSKLWSWLNGRLGTNKPHASYFSSAGGYWKKRKVTVRAVEGLEWAARKGCAAVNTACQRRGVDLQFVYIDSPADIEVLWDSGPVKYVAPGNTGNTRIYGEDGKIAESSALPDTPRDQMSTVPFFLGGVMIYIKPGTSGDAQTDVVVHEIFTHATGIGQHSDDPNDIGYPNKGKVNTTPSPADEETLYLTYFRKDRPREVIE